MEYTLTELDPNKTADYGNIYRKIYPPRDYASGCMIIMPGKRYNLRRINAFADRYAIQHTVGNHMHTLHIECCKKNCINVDEEILNSIFFDGKSKTLAFENIGVEQITEIALALCVEFTLHGVLLKTFPEMHLYFMRTDLPFPQYHPPVLPDPQKRRCAFLPPVQAERMTFILRCIDRRLFIYEDVTLQTDDCLLCEGMTCVIDYSGDEAWFLHLIDGICNVYQIPSYFYQPGNSVLQKRNLVSGLSEPAPEVNTVTDNARAVGNIPFMKLGCLRSRHPELRKLIAESDWRKTEK